MKYTDIELLNCIKQYMAAHDGERPRYIDMPAATTPNVRTYTRRFGSWRTAVEKAISSETNTTVTERHLNRICRKYDRALQLSSECLEFDGEPLNEYQLAIADVLCDELYPPGFGYTGFSEELGAITVLTATYGENGYVFDLCGDWEPDFYVLACIKDDYIQDISLIYRKACKQSFVRVLNGFNENYKLNQAIFNKVLVKMRVSNDYFV